MSLDFSLYYKVDTDDPDHQRHEVAHHNITHNLGSMAKEAGVYEALWRPEENGITKAKEILPTLRLAIIKLEALPVYYKTFDSPNGYGTYIHFVPWLKEVLASCEEYPEAFIHS